MNVNNLVLHLTDRCNLRCKYCFVPHGNGRMSIEVAEAAVDWLINEHNQYARITFFGGEPLLEIDLIRDITKYIQSKASHVMLDIVTNGTLLTDSFFEFAESNNIKISISYDGLLNDTNRVNAHNEPLLNIAQHKDAIKKYQVSSASVIDVSNVHIWHDNVVHLYELGFRAMGFFIDYSSSWEAKHAGVLRKEYFKIADSYIGWIRANDKACIPKIDDMIRSYTSSLELCNIRIRRDLAYSVTAGGDIYPYASAVGNQHLCLGNVISGIDRELFSRINNLGFVKGCENCSINDACVAAIGNKITDDIKPFAFPIACHNYKIAFDVADYVINELMSDNIEQTLCS